ncbi:type II toxin-antitoxin system VapC family toxin [Fischerella sp. JS2]|uniref:type II toxin-antitoxin system VapC family toxin n=1 Tax=Fischerella sp. JS2 TaxID=2597771 RepID=UPI0028F12B44|nr:PIN domain nuclease [Fischerella sp. JS2]
MPQTLTTKPCAKLVMLLIDISVWISVFRDRSGQVRQQLETLIANREVILSRFTQLELLQGSLNEQEWSLLSTYLETQDDVELTDQSWQAAAHIYFDLRRQGLTVRSPIDCCIAQVALENNLLLVHNDRDFETIVQVRPLQSLRFQP